MDTFQKSFHLTSSQALYNQRTKLYPTADGEYRPVEIMTFSEPIFNPHRVEACRADIGGKASRRSRPEAEGEEGESPNECSVQALNRAKRRAFDLMACNPDCNMFVTLTLDSARISRTDWGEIVRKLNVWLDNCVRRRGLKYILVPEYHADGEAVHFHGLMNESALALSDSGKKHGGKTIYNIENWRYGFTTAKRIGGGADEHDHVCKYIFKYMTKSARALKQDARAKVKAGGRYFLHGGALAEPRFSYCNADYSEASGYELEIEGCAHLKIESLI